MGRGGWNMEVNPAAPESVVDSKKGKERRVESLGWITESSVMPKKQRAIEGVGASSIVELRAQLYRTQEDVKRSKDGEVDFEVKRSRKKNVDVFSKQNSGVEERANRDKLLLKATNDGSESYAALEKKAELYDKLRKGELSDEEEKEKYNVDFFRKGYLEDEFQEMERERRGEPALDSNASQDDDPGRPSTSEDRLPGGGLGRSSAPGTSQEHKQFVREVNEETNVAREKAVLLKERRQQLAEKNRQKLRQAFLKKQVEKLKAKADA